MPQTGARIKSGGFSERGPMGRARLGCASRRMRRTADTRTLSALALFQTNSAGTLVDELIGGSS
jgi:hypothetical protein